MVYNYLKHSVNTSFRVRERKRHNINTVILTVGYNLILKRKKEQTVFGFLANHKMSISFEPVNIF